MVDPEGEKVASEEIAERSKSKIQVSSAGRRVMVHTKNVDEELAAELAGVASGAGCELIHAEFQTGILRLFLDRPDGVTLADCQTVSKEVSAILDVMDFGRGRYTLEVSSPGLDRELYGPRDYERFYGRQVRVTWVDPVEGRKRTIVGRLDAFRPLGGEGDGITGGQITVAEAATQSRYDIALADIRTARLEIEL